MAKMVTWTRLDIIFVCTLPVFPELGILCYSMLICLSQQTTIIRCMKSMQARLICRYSLSVTSQKPRNPKSYLRAVVTCDLPVSYIHNALCWTLSGKVKQSNLCLTLNGDNLVVEWNCFPFWMFPDIRKSITSVGMFPVFARFWLR
jgi:hypothetical protein